jgi:hypothetical protein
MNEQEQDDAKKYVNVAWWQVVVFLFICVTTGAILGWFAVPR